MRKVDNSDDSIGDGVSMSRSRAIGNNDKSVLQQQIMEPVVEENTYRVTMKSAKSNQKNDEGGQASARNLLAASPQSNNEDAEAWPQQQMRGRSKNKRPDAKQRSNGASSIQSGISDGDDGIGQAAQKLFSSSSKSGKKKKRPKSARRSGKNATNNSEGEEELGSVAARNNLRPKSRNNSRPENSRKNQEELARDKAEEDLRN